MPRLLVILSLAVLVASPRPALGQKTCDSDLPFGDNGEVGAFVTVGNSEVYYETYGDTGNHPLVLIHGNGGSIASMRCQIVYFMKDYHVVVADNRTHGKSGDLDLRC